MRNLLQFLFPLCIGLLATPAISQHGVRLMRVPDRVVLPTAPGSNLLLEVAVDGEASRVRLARDADDGDSVPLTAAGGGTWQLNLADVRVHRLLSAERATGTFRVFANVGNEVLRSAEIAWSRSELPVSHVCCHIVSRSGTIEATGPGQGRWLDPARIERLELHGLAAPQASVRASAGSTDFPLVARENGVFVLTMNDGIAQSMQQSGQLAIEIRAGAETVLFAYSIVPDRLDAAADSHFTIMQRRRGPVPGTRGWLQVQLDDITGGQVLLTIDDAEGHDVVPALHVGDGDHVEFALAGERYSVVVDRLVNLLIGDDWAELSVVPAAQRKPDRIADLIRAVEAATDITFVREGKDYDSRMAAQLLRVRRSTYKGALPTPAAFVEDASTSKTTGNAYQVRLANGDVVPANQWLTSLLTDIERADKSR